MRASSSLGHANSETVVRPLLSVTGLGLEFPGARGWHKAVDDVTLSVDSGSVLGVVGESGSGKSATALALACTPPAGARLYAEEFIFAEQEMSSNLAAWQALRGREIGVIFQDPLAALNPVFTVEQQLVEIIRHHHRLTRKQAYEKAIHLLEQTRLPDPARKARSYPHELSGGLRQRAMIAMALAGSPRLIIADEPTTALDVTVQAHILSLLRHLVTGLKLSIIFVSHDLAVISALADRVAVMLAGQLVEIGGKDELLANPRHPYTAHLVDCARGSGVRGSRHPYLGSSGMRQAVGCVYAKQCHNARPLCHQSPPRRQIMDGRSFACHFPL